MKIHQHDAGHMTKIGGGLGHWLASTTDQGVPGSRPGWVAVHCGLEQVTFTPLRKC